MPVTNLAEYFEIIETFARDRQWFFRGEHKKYEYPGLPKFPRDYYPQNGKPPKKNPAEIELLIEPQPCANGKLVYPSCMTKQELDIIEEFRKAPPNDEYFHKLVGTDHDSAAWLSFAQHYGEPTRMLDVSRDPLVALYFACKGNAGSDGCVWLYPGPVPMHENSPPYRETFDIGTGFAAQQHIEMYEQGRLHEFNPSNEWPPLDQIFLLEIPEPNERIIAQRGAFVWSPKPLNWLTQNALCVHVDRNAKAEILSKLCSFGIHDEGLKLT